MTLIAAFRCDEGVVLCADQQETVGGIRVAVNKIAPQECGSYQLAFAGSGNGDLIDGFADSLRLDIEQWPPNLSENAIRGNIRNLLLDFHENEVASYPTDSRDDKLNHCLVCVKPKGTPDIFLWELRGSVIVPVGDYALLGIGEAIYRHEIKRLYRGTPSALQTVLLGVHLFSLAKETSNYVGGETDIIFVNESGMWAENAGRVRTLEQGIAQFNERIAALVLACPDTSVADAELEELLTDFHENVMRMRKQLYKITAITSAVLSALFPASETIAYRQFADSPLEPSEESPFNILVVGSAVPKSEVTRPVESEANPPLDSETSKGRQ